MNKIISSKIDSEKKLDELISSSESQRKKMLSNLGNDELVKITNDFLRRIRSRLNIDGKPSR
jgi:hypothetical protein